MHGHRPLARPNAGCRKLGPPPGPAPIFRFPVLARHACPVRARGGVRGRFGKSWAVEVDTEGERVARGKDGGRGSASAALSRPVTPHQEGGSITAARESSARPHPPPRIGFLPPRPSPFSPPSSTTLIPRHTISSHRCVAAPVCCPVTGPLEARLRRRPGANVSRRPEGKSPSSLSCLAAAPPCLLPPPPTSLCPCERGKTSPRALSSGSRNSPPTTC